jgi:hypothetical protein
MQGRAVTKWKNFVAENNKFYGSVAMANCDESIDKKRPLPKKSVNNSKETLTIQVLDMRMNVHVRVDGVRRCL